MSKSMSLAALIAVNQTVTVDYYGNEIDVTYAPARYNADFWDWMNDPEGGQKAGSIPEALERLLVSWDVTGPDGKPIPTTAAAMAEHNIPLDFLNTAYEAVTLHRTEARLGKLRTGQLSPAGTSTPSRLEVVRNGTAT